ncbi:hypothetical protein FPQ14_01260 [Gilliamella apicola]|uniref:Lipoprotein n=1 Tax=Gilliamella apicola TaxID=1196095 RepID=A0A556RSQ8_9GAMM|nr:hypothetical protein [Gilliamella apicola]TSJ91925.1 hypothetical protein FPQ14_01260 [Gilliamella apicola]
MKIFKYSLFLLCSLSSVGCFESSTTGKSVKRLIDNPTDKEIKVAIDGNELAIPAKSGVEYEFEYGKHNIAYNNESFEIVVKPVKFNGHGFINPTQSNYMLHTFIYATENTSDETYDKLYEESLNKVEVILNGEQVEVELPVKVVNDFFIEDKDNNWDYSIGQKIPKKVTENINNNQSYQLDIIKIYRESAYLKFLKKDWLEKDDEISFLNKPKKLSEINQYVFPKLDLESIRCDEGKKYLLDTLDKWQQLFTLTGSDFASKYEGLGGYDGMHALLDSKKLCPEDKDPEQTYFKAIRPLDDALTNGRDMYFFIIK